MAATITAQSKRSAQAKPAFLDEIATRVARQDYGWLNDTLPNPDIVLRNAGLASVVYEELLSDPHIWGCVARRKAATKRLRWYVNREGADTAASDAVEHVLARLPLRKIVGEILDAPLYGFQPLEITYPLDGGAIVPSPEGYWLPTMVEGKPREWFDFNVDRQLRFRPRGKDPIIVPMDRFLLAQYEARYTNPYGFPLLSCCFWPITFKRGGIQFWVKFAEKYGMPWPTFYYPDGMEQAEINELIAVVDRAIQDAMLALPASTKGELINGAQTASQEIYRGLAEFMNDECSKVILGHTGSINSTPGKLGGETNATEATSDITEDDESLVTEQLNGLKDIICDLNFPADIVRPMIEAYKKGDIDTPKAERDLLLKQQGVQLTRRYYMATYGFTEEDIETPKPPVITVEAVAAPPATVGGGNDNELRGSVGGSAQIEALQTSFYAGKIPREAAINNVKVIFGMTQAEAELLFIEPLATAIGGLSGATP